MESRFDTNRGSGLLYNVKASHSGVLDEAFTTLPYPEMSSAEAYRHLVRGDIDRVPAQEAAGRIAATGIFPYPPGIPVLAPGENTGSRDGPVLSCLCSLQDFDNRFPGFEQGIHGIENVRGEYPMECIREDHR